MRILIVAMPDSIHTARWISQIQDQGWDVYLFPVYIAHPHPGIKNITVFGSKRPGQKSKEKHIRLIWWTVPFFWADQIISKVKGTPTTFYTKKALTLIIQCLQPNIVHSLEIQHAGYLTLEARRICHGQFPPWIMSIWGSDLYLFGRMADHVGKIRSVLSACDYFSAECQRDLNLAKTLGFQKEILPCLPMFGGFDLDTLRGLWQPGPISARRLIVLKGYHGWAGRALVGLRALELCADMLKEYRIAIPMANEDVKLAAELMSNRTGIPVDIIPPCSNMEMLKLHGRARTSIGISISDGLPASFAESLVMGSFPIQSCTSCADEWIEDGKSGFIVPPEEPNAIADAIRRALTDDNLVNRAAELNAQTAADRLDYSSIQAQVIKMYRDIYDSRKE